MIVCNASFVFGQLTEESLASAVARQECRKIASELEKTPLLSEGMKFNGAVCYYRNGELERALALFLEVRQMGAQKQHLATFWEAKCYAALRQDSLALTRLLSIPVNTLNYNMLSQKEFNNLAQHSEAFLQLCPQGFSPPDKEKWRVQGVVPLLFCHYAQIGCRE